MARTRSTHFVPYLTAIQLVQSASINSRREYWEWHKRTKPDYLPRHPQRHYTEWESWNAFLGTTNSFENTRLERAGTKKHYRPYWEAVRWAQQFCKDHNIKTQNDWNDFIQSANGIIPDDIPRYPHQSYPEFGGYKLWTGKTIESKIATAENAVAAMMIAHATGQPPNMIVTVVDGNGVSGLKEKWNPDITDKVYRVYAWDSEKAEMVDSLMKRHCHKKDGPLWLAPNLQALISDLDFELERIKV